MGGLAVATSFRILRPGNSATRTGAGTSATVTPAANTTSTFLTRLPIQAGDAIGIDSTSINAQAGTPGAVGLCWLAPPLADGGAPDNGFPQTSRELLVNADIEADADGDGYGDETQDLCPSDGTLQVACPRTLSVDVAGKGTVTGAGISCPGDCGEVLGSADSLQLGAAPKPGYAFTGWSGDCSGKGDCALTMSADRSVTATFKDAKAPETEITKPPPASTAKRKVKVKFASSENGSTFECKLDRKPYKACKSPKKFRVRPGKHKIKVRATDSAGNVDKSPAKAKFRIVE